MATKVKRTYGSRPKPAFRSSQPSTLSSSPVACNKRKHPLNDQLSVINIPTPPPKKRAKLTLKPSEKPKQKNLTQLHFCLDNSILRTCPLCDLSYTKGAPDDESLHRTHCARVQRGMEWGKEEEKDKGKAGVLEVVAGVRLKDGQQGRIVSFRADAPGKIGSKLTTLLETINLSLSSPALTPSVLRESKAYLFLLPTTIPSRERIVGCAIAQRIKTAMAIASADSTCSSPNATLISVDTNTNLYCYPVPLPTPMGIPRLFVPSSHRRQGIATCLLTAAANTFVHGCPLDPTRGEVAFTQPTGAGSAVMKEWGKGGVRVYEEQ